MRSRYSAFAVRDAGYLLATWQPATRPTAVELDPAVEWRRLRIRSLTGGTEDDKAGTVEFVAHYWDSARHEYVPPITVFSSDLITEIPHSGWV